MTCILPSAPHHDGEFCVREAKLPPLSMIRPALQHASGQLPSGVGETVDLPGPAAGFVRVYNALHFVADPNAALTSVTINLQSGGSLYLHQAATSLAAGASSNSAFGMVLFVGETVRFTNGGINTARVHGLYFDTPAYGITPIRMQLSAAGAEVIPAAASGYVNRFFQPSIPTTTSQPFSGGVRLWNADNVAHIFELLQGGEIVNRVASVGAGAVSNHGGPSQVPVTTVPLVCRVAEAVSLTAPWMLYAYETFLQD